MNNEEKNEQEIPAELKEEFTKKVSELAERIGKIEKAISTAIDDTIENDNMQITVSEVNSALLNVLKKFNTQEIMRLVK